jgi:hypothetical protein
VGSEGGVAGGNRALRALMDEAGVSNAALARAVVASAKEGTHIGTSTTSVRRMLNGCQPRWPPISAGACVTWGSLTRPLA